MTVTAPMREKASLSTMATSTSGGKVARLAADFSSSTSSTTETVSVASSDMVDLFNSGNSSGDYVRIIRPADASNPMDRVFLVTNKDRGAPSLTLKYFDSAQKFVKGDLIVWVGNVTSDTNTDPNDNAADYPATTDLTYSLVDDPDSADPAMKILERNFSGSDQPVAGKITDVQFSYILDSGTEVTAPTATQRATIRAVRVTITGALDATKVGTPSDSGVKTRRLETVVVLRNE